MQVPFFTKENYKKEQKDNITRKRQRETSELIENKEKYENGK